MTEPTDIQLFRALLVRLDFPLGINLIDQEIVHLMDCLFKWEWKNIPSYKDEEADEVIEYLIYTCEFYQIKSIDGLNEYYNKKTHQIFGHIIINEALYGKG
jgi:hypothetical protein